MDDLKGLHHEQFEDLQQGIRLAVKTIEARLETVGEKILLGSAAPSYEEYLKRYYEYQGLRRARDELTGMLERGKLK